MTLDSPLFRGNTISYHLPQTPPKKFSPLKYPNEPWAKIKSTTTNYRYGPYSKSPKSYTPAKRKLEFEFEYITSVEKAFEEYKKHLFFHGTSREAAKSISKHGFKIENKTSGCADIFSKQFGIEDTAAKKFHYLMGLNSAARYAKMHEEPKILRVIVPPCIRLVPDPEGYDPDEMRTSDDISSTFILPTSKDKLSTDQLKAINKLLNIDLSEDNNKKLLKVIYKQIIKKQKDDLDLIEKSLDFKSEQQKVIDSELNQIRKSINLKDLKEGDVISLPLE